MFYEFLGTFFLLWCIYWLEGDPFGLVCTILFGIIVTGRFTGAHFNPAVTLAISVGFTCSHRTGGQKLNLFIAAIVGEVIGGLSAGLLTLAIDPSVLCNLPNSFTEIKEY